MEGGLLAMWDEIAYFQYCYNMLRNQFSNVNYILFISGFLYALNNGFPSPKFLMPKSSLRSGMTSAHPKPVVEKVNTVIDIPKEEAVPIDVEYTTPRDDDLFEAEIIIPDVIQLEGKTIQSLDVPRTEAVIEIPIEEETGTEFTIQPWDL